MHFTIGRAELERGIRAVHGVAARSVAMPILENVLIQVDEDGAHFTATDLHTTVTCHAQFKSWKEYGGTSVPAKKALDIVKALSDGDVTLSVDAGEKLVIQCDKAKFKLAGLPMGDFPDVPTLPDGVHEFRSVETQVMMALINGTLFSVSSDTTRQHLAAIYMEKFADGDRFAVRAVSTDGHRLSVATQWQSDEWPFDSFLLSKNGAKEMARIFASGDATAGFALHEGRLFVDYGDITMAINLVDSRYPPYEKVLPVDCDKRAVVVIAELDAALKRVSMMADKLNCGVMAKLSPGSMSLESEMAETGEAAESIDIDYDGPEFSIGMNANYVMDALKRFDGDEVVMNLTNELGPIMLDGVDSDEFKTVIMPVRL